MYKYIFYFMYDTNACIRTLYASKWYSSAIFKTMVDDIQNEATSGKRDKVVTAISTAITKH